MTEDHTAHTPQDAPTASFHDERNALGHWHPKLEQIDVPTPETYFVECKRGENGPEYSLEEVRDVVEKLGGEAHIRGHFASARIMSEYGSRIDSLDERHIRINMLELLSQQGQMKMANMDSVVFREWLDLDWCVYARESLHPECRAFIEDGDVLCHHPRLQGFENHPAHEEAAKNQIELAWPAEGDGYRDHEPLQVYAERIATAFDGSWSVDFVMDRSGDWYCTDMALRALTDRNGYWHSMSEHPGDCEYDLENIYGLDVDAGEKSAVEGLIGEMEEL